jgi:diguanylate cyclase (GGDEF)-like protein
MFWEIIKKNNIALQLFALIITLSALSFYNLNAQRDLLLQQMENDSNNIVISIASSIKRFQEIKSTIGIEKLVNDISLDLEIFEFRYLNKDGVVINSMFNKEIGHLFKRPSFLNTLVDPSNLNKFYFDVRDYVPVMAITYPVYINNEIVGNIDLSVDVSEYEYMNEAGKDTDFSLLRRQVDILNLLTAISGSIRNSIEIDEKTEFNSFLNSYVHSAHNIMQITIVEESGKIIFASDYSAIGKNVQNMMGTNRKSSFITIDGKPVYRIMTNESPFEKPAGNLIITIDAAPYANNEKQLLFTAVGTSALAIFFALFIAYSIYRFNINQARRENIRLEGMVRERTHEIEILSNTDSLTGLWNRGHLEATMALEFKRARRYENDLTIMMIDLDHFKNINDNYGHLAGDEVLRQTAKIVNRCLRDTDFIGRYGGEELVILLPETDIETATIIGEKVRKTIEDNAVVFESNKIPVAASIGISAIGPQHSNAHEVLEEADKALYKAKEGGRNQVRVLDI